MVPMLSEATSGLNACRQGADARPLQSAETRPCEILSTQSDCCLNRRQKRLRRDRADWSGSPVSGFSRVQMHDRRARLDRLDGRPEISSRRDRECYFDIVGYGSRPVTAPC